MNEKQDCSKREATKVMLRSKKKKYGMGGKGRIERNG